MSKAPDCSLYPLHRCKILHMVRHAQGYHNVAGEKDHKAYLSYEFVDASLTPLGWQQVDNLRRHVTNSGIASGIELVVTSPLTRTMQTAVGVFGSGSYIDADLSPPLMVAGGGKSDHNAISSSNCPPFVAVEYCREMMGLHPCDKRKSISEYKTLFPGIDFSMVETDEDVLWKPDTREKDNEVAARGRAFINWLLTRKEKEIAIVSHSAFFIYALALFGEDCHPLVRNEIRKPFANCELRSFVVSDRSAIGTSVPVTNFSGHIPPVPDVPNHDDGEKNMENEHT
ncbi:phosphoglycerate mutase-like protein [Cryptomeria japonica]|uniref:phosphoglycerate mutase-like protein n=1 Tax=Cryptomeria japonica TaxID=3369 RepID=UPI0025AD6783|nr:phosphoglycerate mutase-like protein [Cryptomeria japonica]XP_057867488.1 phosphoglycerate mutase-like protein [Cryptomeria japonica]